jgi:hypothetical protein
MPRVLTVCPLTSHVVPTQAVVSAEAFRRLKAGMAIYCPACNHSHLAERRHLWLETPRHSLAQSPPEEIVDDLKASKSPKDASTDPALRL